MLKSLQIKNMTAFSDAVFEFVPGLNVIVGENITGKSHVLKMGYCILHSLYQLSARQTLRQTDILDASAIQHQIKQNISMHWKIYRIMSFSFDPDDLASRCGSICFSIIMIVTEKISLMNTKNGVF